jgi:group I intron endonuclease
MSKPFGIIYKATNKINGLGYCGQTTFTIKGRKSGHKTDAKNGCKMLFHQAIREFGFDNFTWETLCECGSKGELNHIEEEMIKVHHTHYTENGYNRQKKCYGKSGWKRTSEQIRKGKDHHQYGKPLTEETKKLISDVLSGNGNGFYGRHHSEESIEKMKSHPNKIQADINKSIIMRIDNPNKDGHTFLGKKHSDESKKKMSEVKRLKRVERMGH